MDHALRLVAHGPGAGTPIVATPSVGTIMSGCRVSNRSPFVSCTTNGRNGWARVKERMSSRRMAHPFCSVTSPTSHSCGPAPFTSFTANVFLPAGLVSTTV